MPEVDSIKSTTVRLNPLPIPGWVRAGMRVTSALSPHLAARLAERLFFTPSRLRVRSDDAAVLARAERFSVAVRGGAVHGFSWGRGPTVILIHGWSGHAGQMTSFVAPLLAAEFRVVALDMPGHGRSEGKRSSLVHFAEALRQTSALFGPVRGLVAHSFGAAAAVNALSQGLEVERAVFIAPTARFEPFWDRFREGLGINEDILREALGQAEQWLDARIADMVPLELAPRMETPLLVFHDVDDREVAFEEAESLTSAWKGSVLREIRGLGHHRILRDPDVAAAALKFLETRSTSAMPGARRDSQEESSLRLNQASRA